jgi:hypothetical protein
LHSILVMLKKFDQIRIKKIGIMKKIYNQMNPLNLFPKFSKNYIFLGFSKLPIAKLFSMTIMLMLAFANVYAQPGYYNINTSTGSNAFPLGSTSSNKVQWIYGPTLFNSAGTSGTPATSGSITKVYFRINNTSPNSTFTDFTISLSQNAGTATTWTNTTFVTGMTQCFYQSSYTMSGSAPGNWWSVTLTTPFTYDPSQSLVFEMKQAGYTSAIGSLQNSTGGTQRRWGPFANTTGSTGTGLIDFGFDLASVPDDIGISSVVNPINPCGDASDTVIVQISNNGSNALSAGLNIPVTTVLSGQASGTYSTFFNRALALGGKDTLHMTTLNTAAMKGDLFLKSWTTYSKDTVPANDTNNTVLYIKGKRAARSGTYTVGGASPDYATLNDAFLGLDCDGISGPVVFKVRPGFYDAKVEFPVVPGSSSTNTITIMGSTGNPEDVVFSDSAFSATTANKHTFLLNGVANYIIRDITIQNIGATYGFALHIINGCDSIKIKNCRILVSTTSTNTYCAGIVVNGGDVISTQGRNTNILIDSNYVSGGYYGVVLYGTSSTSAYGEDNTVSNNLIENTYYYNIYSNYQTGLIIDNNYLSQRSQTTSGYGLYAINGTPQNGKKAIVVTNNKVFNTGIYGLYFSSCSGTASDSVKIINNQISGFRSSTTYGIYASSTNYAHCFHNSIYMKGGTGTTRGLYTTSSSYWDILNNVFEVDQSATAAGHAMYINTNTGHNIDYNNYYNPNGTYLIYRAANYTSSTYQTSTTGGANSINTKTNFLADDNLNVLSGCAAKGTPISSVPTDRYGTSRSTTAPFLGAHEAIQYSADAGVLEILDPTNPVNTTSTYDVKLVVKNFGSSTISSLDVGYVLNGTASSTSITGLNLASCDTVHIVLSGTMQVMFGAGVNKLRGFTGMINGTSVDAEHSNDTSDISQYCGPMTGAFTLNPAGSGTSNFISFERAIGALNTCGMGGPVTITLSPGTYNEQVVITDPISGASATNWLTFEGVDPTTRIISFDGVNTSSGAAIELLGTKYITIKNLGIQNMGTSYAMGIRIANSTTAPSDSILIEDCTIDLPAYNGTSGSTNWIGIGITSSKYSITTNSSAYVAQNITIKGNTINGGYYGYGSYGTTSYYHDGISILNNTFNNQYYYPIYTYYYHSNLVVDNNKINNPGMGVNTNSYGIRSYYNDNVRITRNQICNQYGGYGIYSYYDEGSSTSQSIIANNTVNINAEGTTNTLYGIYVYNPTYMDVVYNSCYLNGNSTTGNALYLYFSTTTYAGNNILNNNLVNTGPGYSVYFNAANNTTFQSCVNSLNNNNYFSNGTYPLRFINNIFPLTSMSTWSSSSYAGASNDTKTLTIDPDYSGSCMLSTLSLDIDSAGTPLSNVTTDINGNTRNATHPDIGAYEFDGPNFNIKVVSIAAPNAPASAGAADVKVVIKNAGYATITSANIHYKVNATGTPKTIAYSGNLPFGGIDTITFSGSNAYTVVSGVKDLLIAFSDSPNGSADQDTKNDTVSKSVCEALSGVYTVNGAGTKNYADLMTAAEALNGCGVSAAVTFNVNPGVYNGRLVLNDILGSSATNNVVFQGSTSVASDVNVTYTSTSSTDNGVVILNSTDYITFRNMSFSNNGSTYGQVFVFNGSGADGSDNNTIDSCIIRGSALSTTSNNTALIYSYSQLSLQLDSD